MILAHRSALDWQSCDPRGLPRFIQNGDIPYEDALGPKYADIEKAWSSPDNEMRDAMREAVTEENFRDEF